MVKRLTHFFRRAYGAGLVHLLVSNSSLQAVAYVAQLGMSKMLGADEFGVVRTVEAVLAVLIIAGGFGMPTLAVRAVAHVQEADLRARLTGAILGWSFAFGLVFALLAALSSGFLKGRAGINLEFMAGIIPITVVSRTGVNYFQGVKQFKRISVVMFCVSFVSLVIILSMVHFMGIRGWLWGRYLGEAMMLVTLGVMLRGRLLGRGPLPPSYPHKRLLQLGAPIMAGLLIRSVIDAMPLLMINRMDLTSGSAGAVGFCFLLMSAASLFTGVVFSVVLPNLSEHSGDEARLMPLFHRTIRITTIAGAILTALLMAVGPLIPLVLHGGYEKTTLLMPVIGLGFLPRVLANGYSVMALVKDKPEVTTLCLLAGAVFAVPAYVFGIQHWGVMGAAWASLSVDLVLMCLMAIATKGLRNTQPRSG